MENSLNSLILILENSLNRYKMMLENSLMCKGGGVNEPIQKSDRRTKRMEKI